jgi:hypothetical protein
VRAFDKRWFVHYYTSRATCAACASSSLARWLAAFHTPSQYPRSSLRELPLLRGVLCQRLSLLDLQADAQVVVVRHAQERVGGDLVTPQLRLLHGLLVPVNASCKPPRTHASCHRHHAGGTDGQAGRAQAWQRWRVWVHSNDLPPVPRGLRRDFIFARDLDLLLGLLHRLHDGFELVQVENPLRATNRPMSGHTAQACSCPGNKRS